MKALMHLLQSSTRTVSWWVFFRFLCLNKWPKVLFFFLILFLSHDLHKHSAEGCVSQVAAYLLCSSLRYLPLWWVSRKALTLNHFSGKQKALLDPWPLHRTAMSPAGVQKHGDRQSAVPLGSSTSSLHLPLPGIVGPIHRTLHVLLAHRKPSCDQSQGLSSPAPAHCWWKLRRSLCAQPGNSP